MTKYHPIGSFIVKVDWHHHQLKLIQEDEKATRKKESGLKRTFKGKREEGESRAKIYMCSALCATYETE